MGRWDGGTVGRFGTFEAEGLMVTPQTSPAQQELDSVRQTLITLSPCLRTLPSKP